MYVNVQTEPKYIYFFKIILCLNNSIIYFKCFQLFIFELSTTKTLYRNIIEVINIKF